MQLSTHAEFFLWLPNADSKQHITAANIRDDMIKMIEVAGAHDGYILTLTSKA